mmetsp:Transcript_27577/g.41878  ORF Transcript_27577/g.41878 Transcript_27577/m.41878 type:complete len:160 (-) Transcript_27577:152-631(-)
MKQNYEYRLSKLTTYLKKQGYPTTGSHISFYSETFQVFVNCGPDPIPRSIYLSMADLIDEQGGKYKLKVCFGRGLQGDFYDIDMPGAKDKAAKKSERTAEQLQQRNKERSIGFIIEKVTQWRRLYNGYYDENQELRRLSLEDAAVKVGVSKKSLDDYLS